MLAGGTFLDGRLGGGPVIDQPPQEGELILYRTANDAVRVEVLYESETFWLDQSRIAELFGVEVPTISYHLREIYASGELAREPTLRKLLRVQREGNREVARDIVSKRARKRKEDES